MFNPMDTARQGARPWAGWGGGASLVSEKEKILVDGEKRHKKNKIKTQEKNKITHGIVIVAFAHTHKKRKKRGTDGARTHKILPFAGPQPKPQTARPCCRARTNVFLKYKWARRHKLLFAARMPTTICCRAVFAKTRSSLLEKCQFFHIYGYNDNEIKNVWYVSVLSMLACDLPQPYLSCMCLEVDFVSDFSLW